MLLSKIDKSFPWNGKFRTLQEVRQYLDEDKLICLLCGRHYVGLAVHIVRTHKMPLDDYKERFGIPWTYGVAGKNFRAQGSRRMKRNRKEGKLPPRPSQKHIEKILTMKKRPAGEAFRNTHRERLQIWAVDSYEEYLSRVESGRAPTAVGNDPDMPTLTSFNRYIEQNPAFARKYKKALKTFDKEGEQFRQDVLRLRRRGLTFPEIAEEMQVKKSTALSAWQVLKNQGKLKASDLALENTLWTHERYEEYLRRVASGRTPQDVGNDPDMPDQALFYRYKIRNPAFGKKFDKVWESLPYSVQAQARKLGKRFRRDVNRLHKAGHSAIEISNILGVYKSTIAKTLFRIRNEGN